MNQQCADYPDERQNRACLRAVSPFHEFRQGGDAGIDVEGREHQRQKNQRKASHPFEITDDHAVLGASRGKPYKVNGRDVRGENRRPHREPTQRLAGEEILIRGGMPAESHPDPEGGDADQVYNDDSEVNRIQMHPFFLVLSKHSSSLESTLRVVVQPFHLGPALLARQRDLYRVADLEPLDVSRLLGQGGHVGVEIIARVFVVTELVPLALDLL